MHIAARRDSNKSVIASYSLVVLLSYFVISHGLLVYIGYPSGVGNAKMGSSHNGDCFLLIDRDKHKDSWQAQRR
jgi:hypothetical protein